MKKTRIILVIVLLITGIVACQKLLPKALPADELLDGPVEGLSYEENRRFLSGDVAFNDEVFTSQTGLGPIFVATSCGSCHAGDGKGHHFDFFEWGLSMFEGRRQHYVPLRQKLRDQYSIQNRHLLAET